MTLRFFYYPKQDHWVICPERDTFICCWPQPSSSFKSFDEVIDRANDHELGLCSYVCTNSMETAHLASEQLETGSVAVNTGFVAIAEAPFGGIKQSGYGREGGSMAIKDYLNVKYTHLGIKG